MKRYRQSHQDLIMSPATLVRIDGFSRAAQVCITSFFRDVYAYNIILYQECSALIIIVVRRSQGDYQS